MKWIKKLWHFLKKHFWKHPVGPVRAVEVVDKFAVITYKGQRINLRKEELEMFRALSRYDKRKMMQKFAKLEKAGKVRFIDMKGKTVAVFNRDYEKRIEQ